MSWLCGGKESIWVDIKYLFKYLLQKDKEKCPRCGHKPFTHGYPPNDDWYCTSCHLFEPDWDEIDRWFEEVMEKCNH